MGDISKQTNAGPAAVKAYRPEDVPTTTPDGYHQMDDLCGKDSKKVPNPVIYEQGGSTGKDNSPATPND